MKEESATGIVCVIVGTWPSVSTTFIAQELVGLEREGLRLWMVALRERNEVRPALHDQLTAPVHYLPRRPRRNPLRLWRARAKIRRLPGYADARAVFSQEIKRGLTPQRVVAWISTVSRPDPPRRSSGLARKNSPSHKKGGGSS